MAYPGGKSGSGVYQTIINQMPPHTTYIEPFLGGGAIMKLKRPAEQQIGIDLSDAALVSFSIEHDNELPCLTLKKTNAIRWLDHNPYLNDPHTLIYLDPPYPMASRASDRPRYQYELTDEDHMDLLDIIKRANCMIMISSYPNSIYDTYLVQWRSITFPSRTRGGRTATEQLWMNYPKPVQLHDYRYLGANYRQRERIKRQQKRWAARLERMDDLQRYALMEAIDEYAAAATARDDEATR